ncbi:acid phosphatase-domain-containing protein [Cristinia sonorae]|uniref:Acid phosphatase-domain-containing protein n=1 Tax=Cristinia sonorae TaxID=1940300 RepID=A0A8K0UX69_9AGAR|nr:acid phosphatase-domain-containing protein [Cristinia sonorae]
MYPKLVALDTEYAFLRVLSSKYAHMTSLTIFKGQIDQTKFGRGRDRFTAVEDCLEPAGEFKLWDRRNHGLVVELYPDIPGIITDIVKNGAVLAIVARSNSKAIYDRALWHFKTDDGYGNQKSIIDMVKFDEVYDEEKTVHLGNIHRYSGIRYSDMIMFDDDPANSIVRVILGVAFQTCPDKQGLTWAKYRQGIDQWQRCQKIRSPYLGQELDSYPERMLIGYSGMDEATINLLVQGKNRIDTKESARWGFAMYITDNPAVAQYFRNWIQKDVSSFGKGQTFVCEIWARDKAKFLATQKIWVPERLRQTNVKTGNMAAIARDQEERDRQIEQWGVQTPYILFSRHFKMGGMSLPQDERRFNEMVVYTHIQDALLLTVPLLEPQLQQKLNKPYLRYEKQIQAWNITLPSETIKESSSKDHPQGHCLRL